MYFKDNTIEEGHARQSLRGGAVSLFARAVNAVIQIGTVLFLARLLSPEDFGLVSMVAAITGIAPGLVDLGTRDAVVQRSRISEGEVSALFWLTVAIGGTCALLVAACSPLIARFYGEPRLTSIALVSALIFITSALACQHTALLRRAMKFQELGAIEVIANLTSAVGAVAMAFQGFEYWALVLRPLATSSLLALGVWMRCRWLPGRPLVTPAVRQMVIFGIHIGGFSITDFAGRSSDKIAIGYSSGAHALGYYQNAMFVYENLLDILVSPLHGVATTSLSKMRDDVSELRRLWAKALSTLAFFSMPAFGLLAVISHDLITLLLGTKWASAGALLTILALRGIPHSIERTLGWLHVSAGRTDRWNRWGLFSAIVQMSAIFAGLPYGPKGVAVAHVICMFMLFLPAITYAGRPLGIGATDVLETVWRPLVGSLTAVGIGFILGDALYAHTSEVVRTALLTVAYMLTYLALVVGVLRVRTPIRAALHLVNDWLPARLRDVGRG